MIFKQVLFDDFHLMLLSSLVDTTWLDMFFEEERFAFQVVSRTAGLSKNIRVLVQHEQLTKIVEA